MSYIIINSFKYGWFHGEFRGIMDPETIKVLEFLSTFLGDEEIKIHRITDPQEIEKMIQIFGNNVMIGHIDDEPYHILTRFFYKDILYPYLNEYFRSHPNLFVRYKIDRILKKFYKDILHQYVPIFQQTLELLSICDILDHKLSEYPEDLQGIISEYLIYFEDPTIIDKDGHKYLYLTETPNPLYTLRTLKVSELFDELSEAYRENRHLDLIKKYVKGKDTIRYYTVFNRI